MTFRTRDNDGMTRIVVIFAGCGPATGTAWFDDLKLVEVNQPGR